MKYLSRFALSILVGLIYIEYTPSPAAAQAVCFNFKGIGACIRGNKRFRKYAPRRYTKRNRAVQPSNKIARATTPQSRRDDATIQKALIALGFDIGTPDGVFGPKTRSAIKSVQTTLGEPATGVLTSDLRARLLAYYASRVNKDQVQVASMDASKFLDAIRSQAPLTSTKQDSPSSDTTLSAVDAAQSYDALCKADGAMLGGQSIELDKMSSSKELRQLLSSQLCTARSYALKTLVDAQKADASFDLAGSTSMCDSYAENNQGDLAHVAALAPAEGIEKIKTKLEASKIEDFDAVVDSMEICLGLAFARNKPEDVLLLSGHLVALGENKYGEIIGEQTAIGLGTASNANIAKQWLNWTAEAIDAGSEALIVVQDYDHAPLLRALSERVDPVELAAVQNDGASKDLFQLPGMKPKAAAVPASLTASAYEMGKGISTLEEILDIDGDRLAKLCEDVVEGASEITLRTCRAVAYAKQNVAMMKRIDTQLANLGDSRAKVAMSAY